MSNGHEFFAASFAPVWGHCSAAASMAVMFPGEDNDDTRAGTASHWCGSETLLNRNPGTLAPNGVVVTNEIRDGACMWVDDVRAAQRKYKDAGVQTLFVERKVMATSIHKMCGGTVDSALFVSTPPNKRRIIVWDYKFGHREVDVEWNEQLAVYVLGLLEMLKQNGMNEQYIDVELRIVQPRCYTSQGPIRTWEGKASDLRALWNQLHMRAADSLTPNPVATSGSHCLDCPARHACGAARKSAMAAMDYSHRGMVEPLTAEAISFELDALERAAEAIKTRMTGLEAQAVQMLRQGKLIPGYGVKDTVGHLSWRSTMQPESIDALGAMFGVSLRKDAPFITPTQALAKGIDEAVINAYAERPNRGVKLYKQDSAMIRRILNRS